MAASEQTDGRRHMRCIVNAACDSFIHVTTQDGGIALRISYRDASGGPDFGYLRKLARQGMQLGLLDCHVADGVARPALVVVEPDFMIDISSLAACFTAYGHHPLLYTLGRLRERPNTQATLLGNFAGTALDDIIHHPDTTTDESLRHSFHQQALRIMACADFSERQFRAQAEVQVQNIRQAVDALFAADAYGGATPLLEPSFVCEHLGLQGRVDLMTVPPTPLTDEVMLLVEQKSGRNPKIEGGSHDANGRQLESHYVQLLLYYGVLHYNFGLADGQVDTRLLYSRYPAAEGLLSVGFNAALLAEALKLRNQIVATEMLIARQGFGRILPLLNEDTIYKGIARDAHFHRFVKPELDRLATCLARLTPLERAYFEAMLTAVYREQLAQKTGAGANVQLSSVGAGSDLWLLPLHEKVAAGNIITGLKMDDPPPSPPSEGGGHIVRLMFSSVADNPPSAPILSAPLPLREGQGVGPGLLNFRQGDMLYLYAYDGEPSATRSILFKGTLHELTADGLSVLLADGMPAADTFARGRLWAVEHGGSDTTTNAAIRSLHRFISAPKERRQLLLGQRPPRADVGATLSRSYHPSFDDVLLAIRQARDYFLLSGPPGTGKTSMALRFIVEEELAATGGSILLTAYTNRAVDEICAMLTSSGLPFLRISSNAAVAVTDAEVPIVVATTSMLQAHSYIMQLRRFTLAVIDEASQILEPAVIGLLSSDSVERFVLVGDHKQLPAVSMLTDGQAAIADERLHAIGIDDARQSLFERLLRWEHSQGRTQFVGTLRSHGRMHPDVAAFPLAHFYHREQLHAVPLPHQQEDTLGYDLPARDRLDRLLMTRRLLFLAPLNPPRRGEDAIRQADLPPSGGIEGGRGGRGGLGTEGGFVADVLRRIYRFTAAHFDARRTVGVIVPYRRQITLIRQQLGDGPLADITIDTVERYQGSQRDVIVYFAGISDASQLDFLTATTFRDETDGTLVDRKLNVALTRARRQTIVIGRPDLLGRVPLYAQLIRDYGA